MKKNHSGEIFVLVLLYIASLVAIYVYRDARPTPCATIGGVIVIAGECKR